MKTPPPSPVLPAAAVVLAFVAMAVANYLVTDNNLGAVKFTNTEAPCCFRCHSRPAAAATLDPLPLPRSSCHAARPTAD